jgi:hypothetical protein
MANGFPNHLFLEETGETRGQQQYHFLPPLFARVVLINRTKTGPFATSNHQLVICWRVHSFRWSTPLIPQLRLNVQTNFIFCEMGYPSPKTAFACKIGPKDTCTSEKYAAVFLKKKSPHVSAFWDQVDQF